MSKTIETQNGPLTKGYGDAQLAEVSDVTVRVDGTEVAVDSVEPLVGRIILVNDVPSGSSVEVDYFYTPWPIVVANFNQDGIRFNQWDNPFGNKFPLNSNFYSENRCQPVRYDWTYNAYDYEYSAVFNDPTSARFNEEIHGPHEPQFRRELEQEAIFFEGDKNPEGWAKEGTPLTAAAFQEGLYVIDDSVLGTDNVDGQPEFFYREKDLTYEYVTIYGFRNKVFSYTKDGDFTGVATGWSDEGYLYFLGFLEVNGFRFVGFLSDQGDETEWDSYRGLTSQSVSRTVSGVTSTDQLIYEREPSFSISDPLFIEGSLYEVVSIEEENNGDWSVILDAELGKTGSVEVFREVDWSELRSYRMFRRQDGSVGAYTGNQSFPVADIFQSELPDQPEVYQLLESNQLFFGSLSRNAESRVGWDFVRYSFIPFRSTVDSAQQIFVESDFSSDLPEEDANNPWFQDDNQGYSKLVNPNSLLIEQAGRESEGSFTYSRIEPFLETNNSVKLTANLRVESYADGIASAITIADAFKEVTVALLSDFSVTTLTDYATFRVTGGNFESNTTSTATNGMLAPVTNDNVVFKYKHAFDGSETFDDLGWTSDIENNTSLDFFDHQMQVATGSQKAEASLIATPLSGTNIFDNYLFSARLRVLNADLNSDGRVPLWFGNNDGNDQIYLSLIEDSGTNKVGFVDESGALVLDGFGDPLSAAFDWDDGDFHTYRLIRSGNTMTLFIDGTFSGLSVTDVDLPDSSRTDLKSSLHVGTEDAVFDLDYFFSHSTEYADQAVGLFTGTDPNNPDHYEKVPFDWLGSFKELRILKNDGGETQVFLDGSTTPLFNKQYSELPDRVDRPEIGTDLGYVQFGSPDPGSFSHALWDDISYAIENKRPNQLINRKSRFNVHNVISSPEPVFDRDSETLILESDSKTEVRFASKAVYPRRILSVTSKDGSVAYDYTYDQDQLLLTITNGPLPSERTPLEISFYENDPKTQRYLQDQPANTKLNEGTPPFPLSQQVDVESILSSYSSFSDDSDPYNVNTSFELVDGSVRVTYTVDDSALYHNLDIKAVKTDGCYDLISPACDQGGLVNLQFDRYEDSYSGPAEDTGFGKNKRTFQVDSTLCKVDETECVVDADFDAGNTIHASIIPLYQESYSEATDEVQDGEMVEYGGFIVDSQASYADQTDPAVQKEIDSTSFTTTNIDYTSTVNYP